MHKLYSYIILFLTCAFYSSGCRSDADRVEARRSAAIELLKKYYNDNDKPYISRFYKEVTRALENATPRSLQVPQVAFAALAKKGDGLMFQVTWIENVPSVRAFEIVRTDTNESFRFSLKDEEVLGLRNDAKTTVQYTVIREFDSSEKILRPHAGGLNGASLKLRLICEASIGPQFDILIFE